MIGATGQVGLFLKKKHLSLRRFVVVLAVFTSLLLATLLLSGCGSTASKTTYAYHLIFNVSDVFYKTIDGAPFAVFTYDITALDNTLSATSVNADDLIYVRLADVNGYARPMLFTTKRPDRGIFVEGRVSFVYTNSVLVSYSFDSVKLPTTTTKDPSQITGVKLGISTNGTAQIESLIYAIPKKQVATN